MKQLEVGSVVHVKNFEREPSFPHTISMWSEEGRTIRNQNMPRLVGHKACIVDMSNAHGLKYRVVKLNFNGWRGREQELVDCWVEPGEVE